MYNEITFNLNKTVWFEDAVTFYVNSLSFKNIYKVRCESSCSPTPTRVND